MESQPSLDALDCPLVYYTGMVLMAGGTTFVVSSFLSLGFVGTFLGKAKIKRFKHGGGACVQVRTSGPPKFCSVLGPPLLSAYVFSLLLHSASEWFLTLLLRRT